MHDPGYGWRRQRLLWTAYGNQMIVFTRFGELQLDQVDASVDAVATGKTE